MKTFTKLFSILCLVALVFLSSCLKDKCDRVVTYSKSIPISKSLEEIRVPISVESSRVMENPGKIFHLGNYFFINEYRKGIHVINNSDPSNPTPISFIKIDGNVDISARGNILYADNYVDLLTIDISDPNNITFVKRVENAFPHYGDNGDGTFTVAFNEEIVTEDVECDWNPSGNIFVLEDSASPDIATFSGASGSSRDISGGGIAGSMSRFAINNKYLYVVDNQNLHTFSLVNPTCPSKTNTTDIGFGIETVYPYNDNLFIGAEDGMYIFDGTNPENPEFISRFEHFEACDPVVVQDDIAYVTLRTGNECWGWRNELQVVDISNIYNPTLMSNFQFRNPRGLAVDGDELYLCDGDDGLKSYNIENPYNIQLRDTESGFETYDVIVVPNSDILMVIGADGLRQYDCSNPTNLKLLSRMDVQ